MGDMGDLYREMREADRVRRRQNDVDNRATLTEAGIPFINSGNSFLIRQDGKPKVDFYPTRNKWKVGNRIYYGKAQDFINWYSRQGA